MVAKPSKLSRCWGNPTTRANRVRRGSLAAMREREAAARGDVGVRIPSHPASLALAESGRFSGGGTPENEPTRAKPGCATPGSDQDNDNDDDGDDEDRASFLLRSFVRHAK